MHFHSLPLLKSWGFIQRYWENLFKYCTCIILNTYYLQQINLMIYFFFKTLYFISLNCNENKLTFKIFVSYFHKLICWNHIWKKSTQQITQETPLQLKSTLRIELPSIFFELSKCHAIDHSSMQNPKNDWFAGSIIRKVHR